MSKALQLLLLLPAAGAAAASTFGDGKQVVYSLQGGYTRNQDQTGIVPLDIQSTPGHSVLPLDSSVAALVSIPLLLLLVLLLVLFKAARQPV